MQAQAVDNEESTACALNELINIIFIIENELRLFNQNNRVAP